MKKYILIVLIFFYSYSTSSSTLFDTDYYEIKFISDNVQATKLIKIKEIKYLTIKKILKKILIKSDYVNINKKINEDLINSFIQNVIIENEKIINKNYFSNIKINFNKRKIISYLRNNDLRYVEFFPDSFLTIIYSKSDFEKTLFSKYNEYYNYFLLNNFDIYMLPNLDSNDKYLLNHNDIEEKNLGKIYKFSEKYNKSDIIIIISEKKQKKIFYKFFLITNGQTYEISDLLQNEINYNELFVNLKDSAINIWKINNAIQNKFTNTINCKIRYFNLLEQKEILKKMNNILLIDKKKLLKFSYQEKLYEISYFGNKQILLKLFEINNLKIENRNNNCRLSLL